MEIASLLCLYERTRRGPGFRSIRSFRRQYYRRLHLASCRGRSLASALPALGPRDRQVFLLIWRYAYWIAGVLDQAIDIVADHVDSQLSERVHI